jgi:hypothetical protein
MSQADLFPKLSKNKRIAETSTEDSTAEAIKILSEQIIEIRDIIFEQHSVIKELTGTITILKEKQKENSQNLELTHIDQRDLAKQVRILKANQEANDFTQQKIVQRKTSQEVHRDKDIEELFYKNAKNSTVMKNSQASEAIKKTLAELKKLEKPKQKIIDQRARAQTTRTQASQEDQKKAKLIKKMVFGKTSKLIKGVLPNP